MPKTADKESPLESFWRLTIMLGTMVVVGMALYEYGPPPEQAAKIVDDLASRAQQLWAEHVSQDSSVASAELDAPPPYQAPLLSANAASNSPPAWAPEGTPPQWPAAVDFEPSGTAAPPIAPRFEASTTSQAQHSLGGAPSIAGLTAELQQLGAEEMDLEPWGSEGRLHRFQCSVGIAGGSGFRRHIEAIGTTPLQALQTALAELRTASHTP